MDQMRFDEGLGTYSLSVAPESVWISKPRSTGRLGPIPAWLHEKVPSELGEWELSRLPVPGSRGHPVSAIVA